MLESSLVSVQSLFSEKCEKAALMCSWQKTNLFLESSVAQKANTGHL